MHWIGDLTAAYRLAATDAGVLTIAGELALRHRLQIFDAIIAAASAEAGARLLLSEDMQDSERGAGLRILNPFKPANRAEVEALLA